LLHAQNIGYLVTNLFPFRLGELARSYIAGTDPENGISLTQAISSVVLERMLDVLIIVLLFAAAVPFAPSLPDEMQAAGTLLGILAAGGFMVVLVAALYRSRTVGLVRWLLTKVGRPDSDTWLARTEAFLDGFGALTRWQLLLPVLGLSALVWGVIILAYYGGLRGFWPDASLAAALFALCAAGFGISAPSSPGFVGVFHGAIVLGLSVFPVSTEQALAFALVYHAVMYLIIIALGLISLSQSGQSLGATVAAVRNLRKA
jgi:glycosyltransferase 2 family protein